MTQTQPHILLVTYPAQGHINPSLRFAERLIRLGVKVTFSTSVSAYHRMSKVGPISDTLNFTVFSDGFDDGFNAKTDDLSLFYTQIRIMGKQSLKETILLNVKNGTPVSCLVYTILLPWAAEVARDLNVPSAFLWIQPASVLRFYYYYFNGYEKLIEDDCIESAQPIQLPGLPVFKSRDLPSFCLSSDPYGPVMDLIKEHFEMLDFEEKPKILVNSFDELENEALSEIDGKIKLVAVGPLIPSTILNGQDSIDQSFKGDLFEISKDYLEWMNTKPKGSIVYISFGSLLVFSSKQKEEMARALLACDMPFLWVIRDGDKDEEEVSCMKNLEQLGLIVPWCSQLEVLSHPSLGCFVTHCGWNSTLESIVCGVPVVAFPQWSDQTTNAKLLEDVWGTGVRVTSNKDGVVESEEIKRCIETVMGGCDDESTMTKNAKKWKDLGREAMKETGSSYMNLKAFIEELSVSESTIETEIVCSI